eukprot:TRINITY_DN7771_c0_g1_i1.p1 TRINITY_DN7771_c0_g1~~TRINITY_DN7771_c0_g1_i1.p1  ORF type:complete len:311 (+),score=69.17 TRINITY_DN7771_c0_g1_i1:25-933(+)
MSIITNWDDAEAILHHCMYNELRVAPEEHPTMMILPSHPFTAKSTREKLTQIMFETFSVPAYYLGDSSVLSLLATGRTNGLVVTSGLGNTYIVPVCEGVSQPDAALSTDLAGQYLSERLNRQLTQAGHSFTTTAEKSVLDDIKAKCCYVALDYEAELAKKNSEKEMEYELPDGNTIRLKDERFSTPEVLFKPSLDGFEDLGLHDMILKSIQRCDSEHKKQLYGNIILAGRTTLFSGYADRIKKEIGPYQGMYPCKVIAPPERAFLPWIGGSILSSISSFQDSWITKDEYDEEGPTIVNRKCI